VSAGLRRLKSLEDEEEKDEDAAAAVQPGPVQEDQAGQPLRYGAACEMCAVNEVDDGVVVLPAAGKEVQEALRRTFRGHPGLVSMEAWLEEEGLQTLSQLQQAAGNAHPLQQPGEALQSYLCSLGFLPQWAHALSLAFANKTR